MKIKENLLILVIPFLTLIIGLGLGSLISLQGPERTALQPRQGEDRLLVEDLANSEVISSLYGSASGKITEISDSSLTLERAGGTFTIPIEEGVEVKRWVVPEKGQGEAREEPWKSQQAKFEEIKVGDKVNILIDLRSGEIRAQQIIISPS